ncbi:MAG: choice-of-anchor L domain-containing protein [Pseudomonadota bacterium]
MVTGNELPIDTSASAAEMADAMFGDGITVLNASYTGADSASGVYSDGQAVMPGVAPSDTGVILSTGKAEDITQSSGDANRSAGTTTNHQNPGDAQLTAMSGQQTFDAAVFEAEFVPAGSTLTMQVVFSSEEYLEYVNSGFNDAVGVWVNGVKAELSVGSGDITIDNINTSSNANLYVDNPAAAEVANTEMDGFTVTLTLKAPVVPGQTNDIKIAIADGGDGAYDSNLMIAGNSVQTALVAGDDTVELFGTKAQSLDVLANDTSDAGDLQITHINGQPVNAGDTVVLPTGEEITLELDGTFTLVSDGDVGENTFAYTVEDGDGNSDVAFVTVDTNPPCFVAGVLIDTPQGPRPVEDLAAGDAVITRDHGVQPLRWVGKTKRRALGEDGPVRFAAGALGDHDAQELSPNHRVLLAGAWAEAMFGQVEVLVKAKDLVNGQSITRRLDGASVIYVHLLFDRHEVVCAGGLHSESYHPDVQTVAGFDASTRAEMLRLFPDLAHGTPDAAFALARPVLRSSESPLLGGSARS